MQSLDSRFFLKYKDEEEDKEEETIKLRQAQQRTGQSVRVSRLKQDQFARCQRSDLNLKKQA